MQIAFTRSELDLNHQIFCVLISFIFSITIAKSWGELHKGSCIHLTWMHRHPLFIEGVSFLINKHEPVSVCSSFFCACIGGSGFAKLDGAPPSKIGRPNVHDMNYSARKDPIIQSDTVFAAVVGGGIGGTATAHFLRQHFGPEVRIDVFEKGSGPGVRLATVTVNHQDYESGGSIIHSLNLQHARLCPATGLAVFISYWLKCKFSNYWLN